MNISQLLEMKQGELNIILRALEYPLRTIVENAGKAPEDVFTYLLKENKPGLGFNALTGEFVEMIKQGIIDPTKVVKTALSNASSVASLILISEAVISEIPEKKQNNPGSSMPDYSDEEAY